MGDRRLDVGRQRRRAVDRNDPRGAGSWRQSDRHRARLRVRPLGRGASARRSPAGAERAVIATKVGLEWKDGKVFRNASRARINSEIEDSLRRLQTDHIDIYQVHWPDPKTPIEETAEAMKALLDQGKIGAIGVSNFSVEQMERFRTVAPIHVLQPPYNLFEREIEADDPALLPEARHCDLWLWRALPRAFVRPDEARHGFRRRRSAPRRPEIQPPRFAHYLAAVERLDRLARERFGKRVIHLAARWVLDQGVSTALWGARRPDQLAPIDEVSGWSLDAAAKAEIDRILREEIPDPVGPEFMAPPARA